MKECARGRNVRSHPDALPLLAGERVTLRPGTAEDAAALHTILAEPSVAAWWGEPEPVAEITASLRGDEGTYLLVIAVGGEVAGGIQYWEETDPMYRHAAIDLYLATRFQSQGFGTEALRLLVRWLFDVRRHHRLTIDPAATNSRAIRCYQSVGFRPVGILRQYERGPDDAFHDGLLMDLLATDPAQVTPVP